MNDPNNLEPKLQKMPLEMVEIVNEHCKRES